MVRILHEFLPALTFVALALSLAACAWAVVWSVPGTFRRQVKRLEDSHLTTDQAVGDLRAEWNRTARELEDAIDALESQFKRVDRARRSAAAAASRAESAQQQGQGSPPSAGDRRAAVRQRAREKGLVQ